MGHGTRRTGSVMSMAQSNGVAGPRGMPNIKPPTAPRGPRGSGVVPGNLPKPVYSSIAAAQPPSMWRPAAIPPAATADPAQLVSQFASMNVEGSAPPGRPTYDPSTGPSPSMVTCASTQYSAAPSFQSARSASGHQGPVKTDLCTLTRRTRQNFSRGDIISVPVHKTNRNPNIDLTDRNLTKTKIGGVYSKRRMVVVLWLTYDSMFCLPLHTFGKTGLQKKPNQMRKEFVCVKNEADGEFHNQGVHPPVEANCRHPLEEHTVVPLGDHIEVGYRDDIAAVGEMTADGFVRLLALWEHVTAEAKQEPRKRRARGYGGGQAHSGLPAIMENA